MKALFLNLAFLICTTQLFAQQLTDEATVGRWKVVDVRTIPEMQAGLDADDKKLTEQMSVGFLNTLFTFTEGKDFKIAFPETIPDFMKELEFLNNRKWKIKDEKSIMVGTEEDNYSLMGISFSQQAGKIFFILDETPFLLEVVKE